MTTSNTILVNSYVSNLPAGYGHRKITITLEGGEKLSATTSNMRLTDRFSSDDENESDEAKMELIEMVLKSNDVEFDTIKLI